MMVVWPETEYPPQCCAVALVHKACTLLGREVPAPDDLARRMDAHVQPGDFNPWGLKIAADAGRVGVLPNELETRWTVVFPDASDEFCFRYIPFNAIQAELYWDVALEAMMSGLIVGVGFDYGVVSGAQRSAHVSRVTGIGKTHPIQVTLVDDSQFVEGKRNLVIPADRLESSVLKTNGGFWIIGDAGKMALNYAMPWNKVKCGRVMIK